ncbi:hypothetical protein CC80DRAFT_591868 [Byssothecium circinans]|uniref:Uncharacterized protein n=1 Tax=Byssothecium circinans TaxID=147558 RepID=A0A6A5U571_9PLEO|nr:hypothetical protein CC80DRAFT_591868 [Byssothecium circinans]
MSSGQQQALLGGRHSAVCRLCSVKRRAVRTSGHGCAVGYWCSPAMTQSHGDRGAWEGRAGSRGVGARGVAMLKQRLSASTRKGSVFLVARCEMDRSKNAHTPHDAELGATDWLAGVLAMLVLAGWSTGIPCLWAAGPWAVNTAALRIRLAWSGAS